MLTSEVNDATLPAHIASRVPHAMELAKQKVAQSERSATANDLMRAAQKAKRKDQRIVWLHRWASAVVEPLARVSPCKAGCSHCCHIPVGITSSEAERIASATGRSITTPSVATEIAQLDDPAKLSAALAESRKFIGQPCTFLGADKLCTIYEARPFACRTHMTLDNDDLLCRLIPGVAVPVPYVDTRHAWSIFLMGQPQDQLADIRSFFPPLTE